MNLPNKISLIRIFLIPVFIFFYLSTYIPFNYLISAIIFAIACFTDFLDGYLARKNNLITELGKILDTIADKLVVMAGILLVVADGTIPAPYGVIIAIIIIGRELLLSVLRTITATTGKVMMADKLGKYKATFQFIAISLLMFQAQVEVSGWLVGNGLLALQIVNYSLIGIATLLTLISAINYFVKNRKVLKEITNNSR